MKKSIVTAILVSAIMLVAGKASAQEENGFKKINVKEDFTENGFKWFHNAEILAAGNKAAALGLHTMYIGEVVNAWKK